MKMTITWAVLGLCTAAISPAQAQVVARPDRIGDALQYVVPAAAAGLSLYQRDTEGLKELTYSLALSQGTTEALKHIVNSPRPTGSGRGFPSGHVSAVFASAGYVHQRYGVEQALPFYGLATITAYSRVHTHHHFTKDVLGGAVVGVGSALLLTHPLGPNTSASVEHDADGTWVRFVSTW
ncbi:MAG: Phosphoesterase, PA-phosphatase related protein [Ramlibacter sp.]|jgi:membrane-associated phospholipid phosphatase|nr:Phosphoesterase, PA-phosphatase related protein [Ramlibacter sp.]